jgi:hypothetical protein
MTHVATFEDWVSEYEKVYENPDSLRTESCPNCGHQCLQLVIVVPRLDSHIGHTAFWCDHCLNGIMVDRSKVRPGVEILANGEEDTAAKQPRIPDFRLIPPSSWGGGEEYIF